MAGPALLRMISNVHIPDLKSQIFSSFITSQQWSSQGPRLCVPAALKAGGTQHLTEYSLETEVEAAFKTLLRNRLSSIQHLQLEPDLKIHGADI